MDSKLITLQTLFEIKKEKLENARKILKQEFIGIDKPIDSIINQVQSWYLLSDIQERPYIINLWGLTGVGKTSLVTRLVHLLAYEKLFYRIDLGNKEGKYSLNRSMNELCEYEIEEPVIIALDEFQHTKTIDGPFKSEIEDKNRILWDLIDSGKINHSLYKYGCWRLKETIFILMRLVDAGIKVENGLITKGWENCMDETEYFNQKNKLFISEDNYETIIELAGKELGIHLIKELKETLLKFDEKESLQFLQRVVNIASKPVERDFSKALIFVLGNLDEAYPMSSDLAVDISADEFHKQSLKITIADIKKALQSRFRNEQIARLGNIHVVYPSLSVGAYYEIIKKELNSISSKINQLYGVKICFDASIETLIYNEGVFPTQGVRPVLTTINQLIRSHLSRMLQTYFHKKYTYTKIQVSFDTKSQLVVTFCIDEKKPVVLFIDLKNDLKRYNINTKDDLQSITAVHESGHAIISAVLLGTIPKYIFSKTIENDLEGFVYTHFNKTYISKKEIIARTALYLGGTAAEEVVFGKENITTGSGGDISDATQFVFKMLKKEGLGGTKIAYRTKADPNNYFYFQTKKVEKEAKAIIEKAYALAKDTLATELTLLLEMANYLSDHEFMKEDVIESYVKKYATTPVEFIKNPNDLFYRKHLKNLHQQNAQSNLLDKNIPICLNKN